MCNSNSGIFLFSFKWFFTWGFNLSESIVAIEGNWLHLVLVGQFVQCHSFSTDSSINIGAVVCIVIDNIPQKSILVLLFPRLQQFSQQLYLLPLHLGNQSVLLLSFPDLDIFDSLSILICDVLLPLDDGLLDQF